MITDMRLSVRQAKPRIRALMWNKARNIKEDLYLIRLDFIVDKIRFHSLLTCQPRTRNVTGQMSNTFPNSNWQHHSIGKIIIITVICAKCYAKIKLIFTLLVNCYYSRPPCVLSSNTASSAIRSHTRDNSYIDIPSRSGHTLPSVNASIFMSRRLTW